MPLVPRIGPAEVIPLRPAAPRDLGSGAGDLAYGQAAGTLAAATAQIAEAEQQGNIARGLAGASAQIQEVVQTEATNPDHNGREQRFEQARASIVKQFRDQITGGAAQRDFDSRVFAIGERQRLEVRQGVTARRLDIARGDSLSAVESLRVQMETASPTVRAGLDEEAGRILDSTEASGAITATEKAQERIRFDEAMRRSDARQAMAGALEIIRRDPAAAYMALQDPKSPLSKGLDPYQRQEMINRSVSAYGEDLATNRAAVNFSQSQQDRAQKAAAEEAKKTADDMLAQGGDATQQLPAFLDKNRAVLSSDDRRFYLRRLEAGGGLEDHGGQTDPDTYIDLSARVLAGESIRASADAAFRAVKLKREQRDQLIDSSEKVRFGPAEQYLHEKLRVGEGVDDITGRSLSAEALDEMARWRQATPNATPDQARTKARELGASYSILKLEDQISFMPVPPMAVGVRGAYDISATQAGIDEFYLRKHGLTGTEPQAEATLAADPEYVTALSSVAKWRALQEQYAAALAEKAAAAQRAKEQPQ